MRGRWTHRAEIEHKRKTQARIIEDRRPQDLSPGWTSLEKTAVDVPRNFGYADCSTITQNAQTPPIQTERDPNQLWALPELRIALWPRIEISQKRLLPPFRLIVETNMGCESDFW